MIILALKVKLVPEEQAYWRRFPTHNLEAYDAFLRGSEYWFRVTPESTVQARRLYERAIELDPTYAAAYAGVSSAYWLEWIMQWNQDPQALERAFALAQRARDLDDSFHFAHQMLGSLYLLKGQYEQAIVEAERAVALAPNFALVNVALGNILASAGRPEEGVRFIEKGMRLDPHSTALLSYELARAYYLAGQYDEALPALKRTLARYPAHQNARLYLAALYSETGQEEAARVEVAEVIRINPRFSLEVWKQRGKFKDQAVQDRLFNALRQGELK